MNVVCIQCKWNVEPSKRKALEITLCPDLPFVLSALKTMVKMICIYYLWEIYLCLTYSGMPSILS